MIININTRNKAYPCKNRRYTASCYRKDNTVKEADLITAIKKYLATVPETFAWKEHGGQYGTAGIPDIIVCHRGHFIALEAKVGKNIPTKLQTVTIEQIRKAGGTAAVVRSVEDVKAALAETEAAWKT